VLGDTAMERVNLPVVSPRGAFRRRIDAVRSLHRLNAASRGIVRVDLTTSPKVVEHTIAAGDYSMSVITLIRRNDARHRVAHRRRRVRRGQGGQLWDVDMMALDAAASPTTRPGTSSNSTLIPRRRTSPR